MKIKALLLGEKAVGKTHFVDNLRGDHSTVYMPTIGVDMFAYSKSGTDLHIWDTSGAPRFKDVVRSFFRDVSLFILVYNSQRSFAAIERYLDDIATYGERDNRIVLLCFSSDLEAVKLGEQFIGRNGIWFLTCNVFNRTDAIETWHRILHMCENEVKSKLFLVDESRPVTIVNTRRTFWEKLCIWR